MAKSTRQETFGDVSVNNYTKERRCDYGVIDEETGEIERCIYSASITILRPGNDIAEFYCLTHSKDTWLDMANLPSSND